MDLSKPFGKPELGFVLQALADRGVACFPKQSLDPAAQVAFSRRFGELELHVSGAFQEPGHPEIMILSNIVENGKPIGLADAGQDWHTDMSFSKTIAFVNVLYALKVPRRDGRPLGATLFANMTAAYDALPNDVKSRIEGRNATHSFEKFWDMMRQRGGANTSRRPMTEEQKRMKPPVSQPMVLVHPISRRKSLYADPGTRSALMAWTRRRAMICWVSCSDISCGRHSNMRIAGTRAMCWYGTISTHCTVPKRTIAPMNRV